MRVAGFTIVRNAIKFDYPVVESILSILPICDEFVVAVGNSDDATRELILSIGDPKIRIIDTVWDDSLREGGRVLADETNKAFDAISPDADWAFYLQGDEVIHEDYLSEIHQDMMKWKDDRNVEGLLFNYMHFYGSFDFVGDSRKWYRKEVRIIRNDKKIRSYRDAQGFRRNGHKLNVKQVNAFVFHYGWVKHPKFQQAKQQEFHKLWHDDDWVSKNIREVEEFDYSSIDSLAKFNGTHPKVMNERIKTRNWSFNFDPTQRKLSLKNKLLYMLEKLTGWRPGEYKNYKLF